MSGVGEAELQLAQGDVAEFLHARALSHCQQAINSFTRSGCRWVGELLGTVFPPQINLTLTLMGD